MTTTGRDVTRHPVWFERPVPDDLVDEVESRAVVVGHGSVDDPYAGLEGARGVVAGAGLYDAAFMERAPELLVIARTGIGVDRVDIAAATVRGIAVCNAPDAPTVSTAEHAIALMLSVAKRIGPSQEALRRGARDLYARHQAVELEGKTLGLVGFGRIARRVARMAAGLGMRVVAHDPSVAEADFGDVTPLDDLTAVLSTADVVSLHVPLTAENAGLVGRAEFAAMRPGAIFVNTARGGLVDQSALLEAVESGHLFGAGLDVTDPEPLPPDHPLLHHDRIVVTPHVASGTFAGKRRLFRDAFRQVIEVLDGERPPHLLNPEAWDTVNRRRAPIEDGPSVKSRNERPATAARRARAGEDQPEQEVGS